MAMNQNDRVQLAGIVKRMQGQGKSESEIRTVINAFKQKMNRPKVQIQKTDEKPIIETTRSTITKPLQQQEKIAGPTQEQVSGLLPRATQKPTSLSFGLDLLSAPQRAISAAKPFRREGETFQQAFAKTEGPLRDPALLPTIAMGGPAAKIGSKVASAVGRPILSKVLGAGTAGAIEGATSAGIHQAERVSKGKPFSIGQFATETGVSSVAGPLGVASGEGLKKLAPQVLRSAVKPTLAQTDVVNPPKFDVPLEKGLVPKFGGIEGTLERTKKLTGQLGQVRDFQASISSGVPQINATGKNSAINESFKFLSREAKNPKSKLTSDKIEDMSETVKYWEGQIEQRPSFSEGKLTVEDAIAMRQAIDDEINFRKSNQTATKGFNEASKLVRRKLEGIIKRDFPNIGKTTSEMAEIYPFQKALERRELQSGNNYRLGLLDLGALGAGGSLGAYQQGDKEGAVAGALGLLAARRLTSTPGGASMIYSAGKRLLKPSPVKTGLSQAARSSIFRDKE